MKHARDVTYIYIYIQSQEQTLTCSDRRLATIFMFYHVYEKHVHVYIDQESLYLLG